MQSYTACSSKQPPRPTTADRIEHVVSHFDEDDGCEIYCVAVRNDAGEVLTPRLRADDLRSFESFLRALKNRFGVTFHDNGQFAGRHGSDHWQIEMYELFGRQLTAV